MDYLWSPWRYRYVTNAGPKDECIFCKAAAGTDDPNYIVHRGRLNFVILNIYPYTSGHVMIAPYAHVATLGEAGEDSLTEMIRLARTAERRLGAIYRPHGINLGMNLGECAGAGVAGHIHMHVVPRWPADANFMTVTGETRVLPEDLPTTYAKLRGAWNAAE
jgi:ATP adenylyltransferase